MLLHEKTDKPMEQDRKARNTLSAQVELVYSKSDFLNQ